MFWDRRPACPTPFFGQASRNSNVMRVGVQQASRLCTSGMFVRAGSTSIALVSTLLQGRLWGKIATPSLYPHAGSTETPYIEAVREGGGGLCGEGATGGCRCSLSCRWCSTAVERARRVSTNLGRSSSELHRPSSELHQSSSELHRPSSELHRSNSELHQSSSELHQSSSELHQSSSELHRSSSELHRSSSEFHRWSSELHRWSSELHRWSPESKHAQKPVRISPSSVSLSVAAGGCACPCGQ
jgi:hypothetical protein